jgi:hypothetical protein
MWQHVKSMALSCKSDGSCSVPFAQWCALPYNEATWETPATIKNNTKVEQYERFNAYPPPPDRVTKQLSLILLYSLFLRLAFA